jgi:hypothetical protein
VKPTSLTNYLADLKGFSPLEDESITLMSHGNQYSSKDEQAILLNFASKVMSESRDIDPDINHVVRKHFWELI